MQGGQEGPYLLHTQVTTFQTRPLSPREPEVIPKITKLLPRLVLIPPLSFITKNLKIGSCHFSISALRYRNAQGGSQSTPNSRTQS